MTDATDAALDKAIEAFHKAWPGFRKWFASTALAEIPPEPFEAAIAAYLAALPKGELAEPTSAEIEADHPTNSGRHDAYEMAMRLVGERHEKAALVMLVNHLLLRAERATAILSVPEGWVSAESAPREWEGGLVWQYSEWNGEIKLQTIPHNYSRNPHHCAGVWFIPIKVPTRPAQFAENANCPPPAHGGGPVIAEKMRDLIAMLEKAECGSRELDLAVVTWVIANLTEEERLRRAEEAFANIGRPGPGVPHYTTSIDAALTLLPAKAWWRLSHGGCGYLADINGNDCQQAATPALALIAAILKALKDTSATKEDGNAGADES